MRTCRSECFVRRNMADDMGIAGRGITRVKESGSATSATLSSWTVEDGERTCGSRKTYECTESRGGGLVEAGGVTRTSAGCQSADNAGSRSTSSLERRR